MQLSIFVGSKIKQDKAAAHLGNSHRTATPSEAKKSGATRLFEDMAVYAPPYLMASIYEKSDIRIQTAQSAWKSSKHSRSNAEEQVIN